MTASEPAAVLWDMDGTIVDTEPYWMGAEIELVERFGGTWTHDDAVQLIGSGLERSATILQGAGVDLPVDQIITELTDRVIARLDDEVPWRPGAVELLRELAERDVPAALVTMSISRMAQRVASALPFRAFRVVVCGDEVENAKPHPEPYLRAATLLGVSAGDCIAIEDSAPGVASAIAAGTVTIAVPLHATVPESDDHTTWDGLDGRTVDDLTALYREARTHV